MSRSPKLSRVTAFSHFNRLPTQVTLSFLWLLIKSNSIAFLLKLPSFKTVRAKLNYYSGHIAR